MLGPGLTPGSGLLGSEQDLSAQTTVQNPGAPWTRAGAAARATAAVGNARQRGSPRRPPVTLGEFTPSSP